MSKKTELKNLKKNNNKKIIYGICSVLFLCFIIWVIILNTGEDKLNYTLEDGVYLIEQHKYKESEKESDTVLIDVKDQGIMIAMLYPEVAPISVKNFKKLVNEKFYDNLTFHRVIKDFMIQTGDPTGTGSGGSEEEIKGEFSINGFENPLSHKRGILSMARRGSNPETNETMNSASSQFFIVHKDSEYLDGSYAAFGELLHGFDVLDRIATTKTDENDKPLKDISMNKIIFVTEVE